MPVVLSKSLHSSSEASSGRKSDSSSFANGSELDAPQQPMESGENYAECAGNVPDEYPIDVVNDSPVPNQSEPSALAYAEFYLACLTNSWERNSQQVSPEEYLRWVSEYPIHELLHPAPNQSSFANGSEPDSQQVESHENYVERAESVSDDSPVADHSEPVSSSSMAPACSYESSSLAR